MTQEETMSTQLLHSAAELRRLIIENPDLPLLVFAGEEANSGDWNYMSCSYTYAYLGEFLDCQQTVNDEKCYCEREDFEEDLGDMLYDQENILDEEFEVRFKEELSKYDPYWKPCIILYVNN